MRAIILKIDKPIEGKYDPTEMVELVIFKDVENKEGKKYTLWMSSKKEYPKEFTDNLKCQNIFDIDVDGKFVRHTSSFKYHPRQMKKDPGMIQKTLF